MPDFEPYCRCPGCGECSAHAQMPKLKQQIKELRAERDALRELLREAQSALQFFREWGDALNGVVGYNPPAKSWEPHMQTLARIDAALARAKEGK